MEFEEFLVPMEDVTVMDAIVTILEDQQPHSVAELISKLDLSAEVITCFFRFLAEYSIITYDDHSKKGIICNDFSLLT